MSGTTIEDKVMQLLVAEAGVHLVPATEGELSDFEKAHGLNLPDEFKAWFRKCNGACVSPGSLYPLFSTGKGVSVDWYLKQYPHWRRRGWLPIADDGCGDIYVMMTQVVTPPQVTHLVCFMDQSDFEQPRFAVASGLWLFLYFFLKSGALMKDCGNASWPFEKQAVLAEDPALAQCQDFPLPWELE